MKHVCNRISRALLAVSLLQYCRQEVFTAYIRQGCHELKTHLQAGSPVVMEMQIPAESNRVKLSRHMCIKTLGERFKSIQLSKHKVSLAPQSVK